MEYFSSRPVEIFLFDMNVIQNNQNLISLKEAAEISGYSSDYIGYLIRKNKIWGKKISSSFGSLWMTSMEEIERYQNREVKRRKPREKIVSEEIAKKIFKEAKLLLSRRSFNIPQTILLSFLLLAGLVAISVIALSPKQEILEIFPTVSEGDWNNGPNGFTREVARDGGLGEFTQQNSSFLNLAIEKTLQPEESTSPVRDGVSHKFEKFLSWIVQTAGAEGEVVTPARDGLESFSVEEESSSPGTGLHLASPARDGVQPAPLESGGSSEQNEAGQSLTGFTLFAYQKSIMYSGFVGPKDAGIVERLSIGISMAFEGREQNTDEILVDWSVDGTSWSNLVTFQQDKEYTNALNKGYLSFYLPSDVGFKDIANLRVKLTALSNNAEDQRLPVFLDSVWIEVTHSGQEKLPKVELHDSSLLVLGKKDFGLQEDVELVIEEPLFTRQDLRTLIAEEKAELKEGRMEQLEDEEPQGIEQALQPIGDAAGEVLDAIIEGAQEILSPPRARTSC